MPTTTELRTALARLKRWNGLSYKTTNRAGKIRRARAAIFDELKVILRFGRGSVHHRETGREEANGFTYTSGETFVSFDCPLCDADNKSHIDLAQHLWHAHQNMIGPGNRQVKEELIAAAVDGAAKLAFK